jgi:hypothetical protein
MSSEINIVKSCRCVCNGCGRHGPEAVMVNGARAAARDQHWLRVRAPTGLLDGEYEYRDLCPKCAIVLQP